MAKQTDGFDRPTLEAMLWLLNREVVQEWPSPIRIEPLLRIFERLWFTHLWVVQEILLASENTCVSGDYEMDWHSLAKAAA